MRALRRGGLRLAWITLLLVVGAAPAGAKPVQSHSMIHLCCTPPAEQDALIASAKASGAGIIRLDVELNGIVRPMANDYRFDFAKLDRLIAVARHDRIRILAVLGGTPGGMTDCPPGTSAEWSWKCPPADPEAYARDAVAVMEHAGTGVLAWEFWNEPDLAYMYTGTPEQYGRTLGAIDRLAAGRFRITNGGVAGLRTGLPFLRRAIAAGARFDIGNIHLRGTHLRASANAASHFFGRRPLWVTEHGYPSDPDPQAQVRYLSRSIPALRSGGADQVFVTLRDIDEFGADSPFASEGILGKPAWKLILDLNHRQAQRAPRAKGRDEGRRVRGDATGQGCPADTAFLSVRGRSGDLAVRRIDVRVLYARRRRLECSLSTGSALHTRATRPGATERECRLSHSAR